MANKRSFDLHTGRQPVVLFVDDEKNTRDGLRMSFEDSFDVYLAADIEQALLVMREEKVDVMVTDLRLGGDSGMDLIDKALKTASPPVCIMMTAYGSVDTAVEAMKRGAYDFVTKPLNIDELEILIRRGLKERLLEEENISLKATVARRSEFRRLLGKSHALAGVLATIEQVAPTRATVLIEGESGTGKELAAHALHELSGRPKEKMVTVHCAALSPQLLESELFGHEKGAFTGASERRIGRFEHADGGTLFLDEIGEIDASTQVKLLRVLGERRIERVGGNQSIPVDVRVVAATNRDLQALVAAGDFREDLYFRLDVVRLLMPPLRDRPEDIPLLAEAFLTEFCEENNKEVKPLDEEARDALLSYSWPGNVRELRTAIEHGVVISRGDSIRLADLPASLRGDRPALHADNETLPNPENTLANATDFNLHAAEQRLIRQALARTGQNRTEAAGLLGISRRTLQRKLKEMGLVHK